MITVPLVYDDTGDHDPRNAVRVLVVPPTGAVTVRRVAPELDALQALIGGGYLEEIRPSLASTPIELRAWHGYCDEEGKMKGLTVNMTATVLARRAGWNSGGDVLCGTVIFLGDAGDAEYDVPEALIQLGITHNLWTPA